MGLLNRTIYDILDEQELKCFTDQIDLELLLTSDYCEELSEWEDDTDQIYSLNERIDMLEDCIEHIRNGALLETIAYDISLIDKFQFPIHTEIIEAVVSKIFKFSTELKLRSND